MTTGGMLGSADVSKVIIDLDNMTWTPTFNNTQDTGGIYIVGNIYSGTTANSVTNITPVFATNTVGVILGGILSSAGTAGTSGFGVSISAGAGYVDLNGGLKFVQWPHTIMYPSANQNKYISITNNATFVFSDSLPDGISNILLGRVKTLSSDIEFIDKSPLRAHRATNHQLLDSRDIDGTRYINGSVVTENATPKPIFMTKFIRIIPVTLLAMARCNRKVEHSREVGCGESQSHTERVMRRRCN